MRRTRSVLTALFAALGVLIIVAATGNQGLNQTLVDHADDNSFRANIFRTLLSFSWRFTPGRGSNQAWAAQLVGVGAFLLLTFVFVWAVSAGVARPAIGIFVGIWASVALAGALAGIARNVVFYSALFPDGIRDPFGGRASYAVFQGANSFLMVFAITSGLLIALFTTIIAAATSREVPVATSTAAVPAAAAAAGAAGTEWVATPAWTSSAESGPWRGEPAGTPWQPAEVAQSQPTESFDTPWTAAPGSRAYSGEEQSQTQQIGQSRADDYRPASDVPIRGDDQRRDAEAPRGPSEQTATLPAVSDEPRDEAPQSDQPAPSDGPRDQPPPAEQPQRAEQTQRFERPPRWPDDPDTSTRA